MSSDLQSPPRILRSHIRGIIDREQWDLPKALRGSLTDQMFRHVADSSFDGWLAYINLPFIRRLPKTKRREFGQSLAKDSFIRCFPRTKMLENGFLPESELNPRVRNALDEALVLLRPKRKLLKRAKAESEIAEAPAIVTESIPLAQTTPTNYQDTRDNARRPWPMTLLKKFRYFCDADHQKNIDCATGDLIKDWKQMQTDEESPLLIYTALTSRVILGTILPILADGLWRLIRPVKEVRDLTK